VIGAQNGTDFDAPKRVKGSADWWVRGRMKAQLKGLPARFLGLLSSTIVGPSVLLIVHSNEVHADKSDEKEP
jgi:hypothetical protein